jgi:2-polyprenyl-6-methoxyphenol hydroxylase-like FAD-dependent oxidoreductase
MSLTAQHTKVLIIGAGPSGLMMAAQLLRYGIQPIIIDDKDGPTTQSKALVVQARSLEIYRQMGIIDTVIHNGKAVQGAEFNIDGKQKAKFKLTDIGEGQTLYPFLFLYQQSKNERVLLDYLTQKACPVYWNTSLTKLTQKPNGAEAEILSGEQTVTITCDWLIGADGAHSAVRKQSQIPFNGDTYQHNFYLVDALLDNDSLNEDYIQLFLTSNGFAGFFPMMESKNYRIIGNLPNDFDKKENLQVDDILPFLNNTAHNKINVTQNNWFIIYRLHHRMADSFRANRCFLIGDAAHIHSPVGGQGMNTGLQDAYNLAWKLAGVINNQLSETILNSYAAERMPVAKTLLSTTDRVFNLVMSRNWFINLFKKLAMPKILNYVWTKEKYRETFFRIISQTGITYRDSNINLHLSQATKIKAGDRLPYIKIFDEKQLVETDLHEWCSKPGFTLIILGKFDEMFLFTAAKWITNKYAGILNFYYLPPSGKNLELFEAFETNPHQQKAIIVRPDMYIGYLADAADIGMMDNYLRNVVGVSSSKS